jgi:hypothetical protein
MGTYWDNTTSSSPTNTHSPLEDDHGNSVFVDEKSDPDEPRTWPTLYLPLHTTPGSSRPQHINDILRHVHYKGAGAKKLRDMLYEALQAADLEEDKLAIEFKAYLHWPFNITLDGYWKGKSGMTEKDIDMWKEAKKEMPDEGDDQEAVVVVA